MANKKQDIYRKLMQDFPVLYCQKSLSCMETCMCWGIEAGTGWEAPLRKLSKTLEDLNKAYWKTKKIRVQADQVKEKYGTLHFYYSIIHDPPFLQRAAYKLANALQKFIQKHIDFKMTQVMLTPASREQIVKEITLKEYDKALRSLCRPINVKYEVKDGKVYKLTDVEKYGTYKYVPTRHKLIYWISTKIVDLRSKIGLLSHSSDEIESIRDIFEQKVEEAVRKAEAECYCTCESCGKEIGTKSSPRCNTIGWITYICSDCGDKTGRNYSRNGAIWNSGKMLKSRKEQAAHIRKIDAKYEEESRKEKKKRNKEADKKIAEAKALIKKQKQELAKKSKAENKKRRKHEGKK